MTPAPHVRPAVSARPLGSLLDVRVSVSREWLIFAAVLILAAALRFWDLGTRALHHDESIHARWSWDLLQGNYRHSPIFHGPFYYHIQGLVFFLFGATDYTARVSAAIFGTALTALPLLLRQRLGFAGTLAAVCFLAFSPTVVFYSRFFREDIYMGFFSLLMAVSAWRYLDGGRERWLVVLALAFTGAMTTKEGTFLLVAVFLVAFDLLLAADLADRIARPGDEWWRRPASIVGFAPLAWAIAALWPMLPPLRRALRAPQHLQPGQGGTEPGWALPRTGDVLLLIGTLTLPLLTPWVRGPVLEHFDIVAVDRLNWEKSLQGRISADDRLALAGLFAITTSAAAFVGMQWRPRLWTATLALCTFLYLALMTSLFTNANGLVSGPWGSLDYWITQQHVSRGDQPWFYYYMLFPAYEFLPLSLILVGAWWSLVRRDRFAAFLWIWLAGMFAALSYGAEKMPWLNTHLAIPAAILAAVTVQRAWGSRAGVPGLWLALGSAALLAFGGVALAAYFPASGAAAAIRVGFVVVALAIVVFVARPYGRAGAGAFAVAAVVGALGIFSLRTMLWATYERGDVPHDMLIYTQSSPQLARVADDIDRLAEATGLGFDLPIAIDNLDAFAWPWAWYLRDYRRVAYVDMVNGPPQGDYPVLLVNASNFQRVSDGLQATGAAINYGPPQRYPHRLWFDEFALYKKAMAVKGEGLCLGLSGDCGPRRLETWRHIAEGFTQKGWWKDWLIYWRDHYLGVEPGSTDAYAFFPANFSRETGKLVIGPQEPIGPSRDSAGRLQFGGLGRRPGEFFAPADIEADVHGNLYVIDRALKKLQKFDAGGHFIVEVDVRRNPADLNEGSEPWGLAIAPTGEVVVLDTFGYRVLVFSPDLKLLSSWGSFVSDKNPGPLDLWGPRDAAFDDEGNLWVSDTGHDRIVVYTLTGQFVRAFGVEGTGSGQFNEPVGITRALSGDGSGALAGFFIADMYNSRVVVLDRQGNWQRDIPIPGWGGQNRDDKPYIEALRDGGFVVSLPEAGLLRVFDATGRERGTIDGGGTPLQHPYGVLQTADAKLWIVEGGSGLVRQFDLPR